MPTVSVVIPCYNQATFLGEAIESALAQTVPGVEVVVVDDGSQDATAGIVARYPGVRYVRQANEGVARARNRGACTSRGSHLIFLDADDRLLPHAAAAGLALFEAHPETALVRGYHDELTADGVRVPVVFPPGPEALTYETLLSFSHHIAVPSEAMFRREAFEGAGGFHARFYGVEDLDLYFRIARRFPPIRAHREVVTVYRRHPESMSHQSLRMLRSTHALFEAQLPFVRGDRALERAHRAGHHWLSAHYTSQLVGELRRAARQRRIREVAVGALALLRYQPRELTENAGRKVRSTLGARLGGGGGGRPADGGGDERR